MRKALVVGIDDYPGSARLKGCVNDAMEVASLLDKNADGSPNFDVLVCNNIKTKAELKAQILKLFKGEDEISLFYFSGHGYVADIGGYIVTPDFKQHDEGISMDEILKIASLSAARHKIVILDCCHAGAMGMNTVPRSGAAFLEQGVIILASSQSTELSMEAAGQGVFTSLLIEALKGGAADIVGEVTPGNIYSYIDKALGGWKQRPVFKANIVRTISLRRVQPLVAHAELRKLTTYFQHPDVAYQLDPSYEYTAEAPDTDNIRIFKILRRMNQIGLLEPEDEEYMYWAAINSKTCRLTPMGRYYWRLLKEGRI